jgi:hypothetical protein
MNKYLHSLYQVSNAASSFDPLINRVHMLMGCLDKTVDIYLLFPNFQTKLYQA